MIYIPVSVSDFAFCFVATSSLDGLLIALALYQRHAMSCTSCHALPQVNLVCQLCLRHRRHPHGVLAPRHASGLWAFSPRSSPDSMARPGNPSKTSLLYSTHTSQNVTGLRPRPTCIYTHPTHPEVNVPKHRPPAHTHANPHHSYFPGPFFPFPSPPPSFSTLPPPPATAPPSLPPAIRRSAAGVSTSASPPSASA